MDKGESVQRRSKHVYGTMVLRDRSTKLSNNQKKHLVNDSTDNNEKKKNKMVATAAVNRKFVRRMTKKPGNAMSRVIPLSRRSRVPQTKHRQTRRIIRKKTAVSNSKKRKVKRRVDQQSDDDWEPPQSLAKKRKILRRLVEDIENSDPVDRVQPQVKCTKGNKRSSPIWNHFDEITLTDDGVEKIYAKCKHCPRYV